MRGHPRPLPAYGVSPISRTNVLVDVRACTRVPRMDLHGKEGVDGSSPSEGFDEMPANRHFSSPACATRGYTAGTSLASATQREHGRRLATQLFGAASRRPSTKALQARIICCLDGRTSDPLPPERGSRVRVRQRTQEPRASGLLRSARLVVSVACAGTEPFFWSSRRSALAVSTESTQMGVLEVIVVLEAVPDQAIDADVGEPDQAEREDQRLVLPPADCDGRCR
jgi:hypothetical protein